ncbi:lysozyme inhibitor LprI family protein [Brucella pseudintermedia]|uniref:lysozyme inhibitor LprI family protein n=2 Tax=Brucella pseudintermedia TaxID=370111 RepID=UPI003209465F
MMKTAFGSALLGILLSSVILPAHAQGVGQEQGALAQCNAQIGSQPRTELASCLDKLEKQAKSELAAKLRKLRKDITDTGSSASEAALKSLAASERQFELFRKAECRRVADVAMGGSGAGDFERACKADLLRWRISRLDQ